MERYGSFEDYEDCGVEMDTVQIPHQPLKGFRRELDVDFDSEEINSDRVRRELKSLQERLSYYYCMGREEREKHRLNILQNLNQLDLYWFEYDDFDKAMFRFRSAWTNHLVDETIEQLYRAIGQNLKDLWALEYEIGFQRELPEPPSCPLIGRRCDEGVIGGFFWVVYGVLRQQLNQISSPSLKSTTIQKITWQIQGACKTKKHGHNPTSSFINIHIQQVFSQQALWTGQVHDKIPTPLRIFVLTYNIMDVKTKISKNLGSEGVDSMGDFVMHALLLLKMELDKLESQMGKKREAHRRLLLEDLRIIKANLMKEQAHQNGLIFLIDHFNRKVVHSLRTSHEYCMQTQNDFLKLLANIEYICEELMNRLILDNAMPEYEKALLGNELNNFRKDAKAHIEEVDNFHYELRELVKGINMKKLRGLTKDEYKEKVHSIIAFLEKAEVPLHVFKSVGFDLKRTEEVSATSGQNEPARTGVEEKDYESE